MEVVWGAHQSVVPRSIPIALGMTRMSEGNEIMECRKPDRHLRSCESNLLEAMQSHVHKPAPDLNVQSQNYVVETKFIEYSSYWLH